MGPRHASSVVAADFVCCFPGCKIFILHSEDGGSCISPGSTPCTDMAAALEGRTKKVRPRTGFFFRRPAGTAICFFFCSHSICGGAAMRRIYRDTGRNMEYLLRWERKRKPHRHRKRAAVHHNNNVPVWIIFLPPFHLIFSIRSAAFVSGGRESGLCLPLFFFFSWAGVALMHSNWHYFCHAYMSLVKHRPQKIR